jgi:hypothetical protein
MRKCRDFITKTVHRRAKVGRISINFRFQQIAYIGLMNNQPKIWVYQNTFKEN